MAGAGKPDPGKTETGKPAPAGAPPVAKVAAESPYAPLQEFDLHAYASVLTSKQK